MPPSDLALLWAGDRTRSVDRDNVSMSHVSRLCVDAHLDQAVSAIPRTLKDVQDKCPTKQPARGRLSKPIRPQVWLSTDRTDRIDPSLTEA